MIPRYTRPEMAAIWSPQTRLRIWFEIEAHAADAMADLGIIPKAAAAKIWAKGKNATFDIARIDEIEREVKHDVIAFLTHLTEIVGPEARFVHQGMTSSDVLDTCLNVQLVRAADLLIADVDKLNAALERRAREYKFTPTIGRSHGIHAEPTTFGLKLAYAYAEFARARERLAAARSEVATCAISGAVGTFAQVDPRVEAYVAKQMGLRVEPISTQVIPRDRHAMYFATLGVVAGSVERLATEIRHLQRTEVLEAEEYFSEGQKGSSAMPHKRNPVLSENLVGLARMVRAYVTPALENIALWHERDISHSSVERMIGPDATVTLDFALARLAGIVDKLIVYPDNMQKNLDRLGGLVHSQRVLLALTQKGVAREEAYRLVQRNAMKAWRGEGDFLALLKSDAEVRKHLSDTRTRRQFRPRFSFRAGRHDLPACLRPRLKPRTRPPHHGMIADARFVVFSLSPMDKRETILVFDSGLGGLTVYREIAAARPNADFIYVADDAAFPYGAMAEPALVARVVALIGELIAAHRPDLVVIACNTASTIVLPDLRRQFSLPFVGTVPAIKPACASSNTKRVSVLGTEATVAREYTRALIRDYAQDCQVTLVGAKKLAGYAEAELAGAPVSDAALYAEIAPCFRDDGARTDTVVLACTHYPLLIDRLQRLAPWPVNFLDPAPAIARRVGDLLGPALSSGRAGTTRAIFTSGRPPAAALARFGIAAEAVAATKAG